MQVRQGDYIEVSKFTDEEIEIFVELSGLNPDNINNEQICRDWMYYGVDSYNELVNYNKGSVYDLISEDVTLRFREYLNSKNIEETLNKQEDGILHTLKERLQAVIDEKPLEYRKKHDLASDIFTTLDNLKNAGQILFSENYEVRIKKCPIKTAFLTFCSIHGYDPEQTDFETFRAGYKAANS